MSIFTRTKPKQRVEIVALHEDFIFDGRIKPQVIVRFNDGWEVEWLVEELMESKEGEVQDRLKELRNGKV